MEDKLFCDRVAKGELSKNDILKFAESVEDKVHLCWLLFCRMPSTKTAQAETERERLGMAMAWIQTKYSFDWDGEYQDEQPNNLESTEGNTSIELKELMNLMPENLRTEQAYKVFGKAIGKGLITKSDNGFSWEKTNVLLCFMFGRLYCGDYTFESKFNNGKPLWKKGVDMLFPESCIEEVFRIKNTSQSRKQAASVPNGYSVVEDIFKAV